MMLLALVSAGVLGACQLTEWEQLILDQHNTWRASTAPPAKDMLKVRWDTNIAKNMASWLSSCYPNWPHSDQKKNRKDVGGYEYLGENLAYCAGTACPDKLADGTIAHVGQGWWDEKDDYDYANDRSTGGVTSHYTQMASSNIYAMGCAAQKCNSPGPYGWQGEWWWVGCQYGERGQGYWVGTKPYEQGSGGLIEPPASVFTKNPGLCKDGGVPPAPTLTPPVPAPPAPGGSPSSSPCPRTEWEQLILDQHNTWRASTSPPAKDMLKVRWDTNIAKNMASWLSSCDSNWPHSDQKKNRKDVGGYEFLGENLAYCAGTACPDKLADGTIAHVGQGWWDEKDDYNYATDSSTGGMTAHYTQMASSNIYAMGCAAQKCNSPGPYGWQGEWWWIGCQYGERGQGYWVGTKPYEQGSGGLIEPPASVFTKNPGLCKDGGVPPPPAPAVDECAADPCGKGQTCKDPDQLKEKDFTCECDTDPKVKRTGSPATCPSAPAPGGSPSSSSCPLTEWEQLILDQHNTWRASTSPPAKDMLKVRWDTNIAKNMASWLSSCDPNWPHSDQKKNRKDVGGYEYLGENLAYCAGTACPDKLADGTIAHVGQGWWDEKDDYDYATDSSTGGMTAHYTQMASSNIYAMGCAAQKCNSPGPYGWQGEWWWVGCQYGERGQGYWVGTKPYEQGSGGLIEPPASVFTKNPGLCKDGGVPPAPTPAIDECAADPCGKGQTCNDPNQKKETDFTCTCDTDPKVKQTGSPATCPSAPAPCGSPSSSSCPLTEWEQLILDQHNTWRASTSPPAKDMLKVRWDTNIAKNMASWLSSCDSNWPHSDQKKNRKDVGGYEFLGENLAYCAGTACPDKLADGTIAHVGQGWWDEKDDYNYATDSSTGGITSHYTQMASSNIYAMGCAAQKCNSPGPYGWQGEWWWVGCQYGERGQGYWVGTKPYEQGSGGLVEPPASVFTKNPGLCNDGGAPPAPSTLAPVTASPSTPAPPVSRKPSTPAPVAAVPLTSAPTTLAPLTVSPLSSAPATPAPSTLAPDTASPPTPPPSTPVPATRAPLTVVTPAPSTTAPTTLPPSPATSVPATASPGHPGSLTAAPATPQTLAPVPAPAIDECAADPCGKGQTCNDPNQKKETDFTCTCDTDPKVKQTGSPATCPSAPAPCGSPSSSSCPLTEWEQLILDQHNTWRASTSPPAKDMLKVRWDTNIAKNMASWMSSCDPNWPHSDQKKNRKDVGGYEFLGENLAYCAGTACPDKLADGTIAHVGQGWWDEKDDYNYATDSSTGGITSHYTQMASSNIYAMGCAAQKCNSPGPYGWQGEWWWVGCQYGERGQGYWVGTKPYEQGSGGLVEPPASVFTKNPGLCKDGGAPPAPATPAPSTLAPVTASPSTPAPSTPVPATVKPSTPAPVAAGPLTSAPTTLPPSPATSVPATASPGHPGSLTAAPATPQTLAPVPAPAVDECAADPCGKGQTCKDPDQKKEKDFTCTCDTDAKVTQTGSPAACTQFPTSAPLSISPTDLTSPPLVGSPSPLPLTLTPTVMSAMPGATSYPVSTPTPMTPVLSPAPVPVTPAPLFASGAPVVTSSPAPATDASAVITAAPGGTLTPQGTVPPPAPVTGTVVSVTKGPFDKEEHRRTVARLTGRPLGTIDATEEAMPDGSTQVTTTFTGEGGPDGAGVLAAAVSSGEVAGHRPVPTVPADDDGDTPSPLVWIAVAIATIAVCLGLLVFALHRRSSDSVSLEELLELEEETDNLQPQSADQDGSYVRV